MFVPSPALEAIMNCQPQTTKRPALAGVNITPHALQSTDTFRLAHFEQSEEYKNQYPELQGFIDTPTPMCPVSYGTILELLSICKIAKLNKKICAKFTTNSVTLYNNLDLPEESVIIELKHSPFTDHIVLNPQYISDILKPYEKSMKWLHNKPVFQLGYTTPLSPFFIKVATIEGTLTSLIMPLKY